MRNKLLITLLMVCALPTAKAGNLSLSVGALYNSAETSASMGIPLLGAKVDVDAENDLTLSDTSISPYLKLTYQLDNDHAFFFD